MSSKKIISVNPDFFAGKSLVKSKKNKTRKKKTKPISTKFQKGEISKTKKELINRFAKHKEKQRLIEMQNKLQEKDEFENNYNQAVDFLQKRLKRRETRKKKHELRKRMKQMQQQIQQQQIQQQQIQEFDNHSQTSFNDESIEDIRIRNALNRVGVSNITQSPRMPISTNVPVLNNPMENFNHSNNTDNTYSLNSLIKPPPKYGILKGGKRPLYSQRKNKLNNLISNYNANFDANFDNDTMGVDGEFNINTNLNSEYQNNEDEFGEFKNNVLPNIKIDTELKKNLKRNEMKQNLKRNQVIRKKKTYKRKLKLGKRGNKVSVLIKNNKTRKKVKHEHGKLKAKPIEEIKRYLRRHNLIKVGTTAPERVLRDLFETSFLSGDVYNKNKDILLHNYMLDENDDF